MPRMLVEKGPDRGKSVTMGAGQQVVVGRDVAANLQLSDQMCSRRHFLIAAKGSIFGLKDLGSANGTLVNGRRMQNAHRLEYGDTIQIGETLISWLPDEQTDKKGGLIGQQIGGYRIEERLGRGAMGTVYKATQMSLGRTVALKVLSPELTKDPKFCDMFLKEARAAGGLNHPNIIQVYDVGDEGGQYYFSMEYAAKGSVLEELGQQKNLPLTRAIKVIRDSCAALDYAERKGLVHRDIKPDNLMVTEDNTVKLGDLGLAMSTQELAAEQDGVFGTPHYIAPEQAMGKPIDHRADIYALGASFYRMLAGRTLFEGATVKEILKKQVRDPHDPITLHVPNCPAGIATIIDRMLQKNPAERYQHASDVLTDLANFEAMNVRQSTGTVSPFAERPPGLAPAESQEIAAAMRTRNLALGAIAAGVAVLALAIVLWLFVFSTNEPANNTGSNTTGPIAAANNTPAANNAGLPQDVQEHNERLREALNVANYQVGVEGAGRKEYTEAVQRLGDALGTWLKATEEWKNRVSARRKQLENELLKLSEGVDGVRAEWEVVRKDALQSAEDFKFKAGGEKIAVFVRKFEADANPEVKKVSDEARDYLADTSIGPGYPRDCQSIMSSFENAAKKDRERALAEKDVATRLASMDTLQQRVAGKAADCDDETYKKRLDNLADELLRLVNILREDAARAERDALEAAFKRASAQLDVALRAAAADAAMGNFAQANRRLEDFELSDQDYAHQRDHERFKSLREDLARRRDQTNLEFASLGVAASSLTSLFEQGQMIRRTPWPEAVSKEFGSVNVVFSLKVESKIKDSAWSLDRFDGVRNMGTWTSTQLTTAERRKAVAGALAYLLQNDAKFSTALLRTAAGQTVCAAVGLFALLAEMECYDEAFLFIDLAWKNTKQGDAGYALVREYYAWGLLGRAEAAVAGGRTGDANAYLKQLAEQFADTRANKGRK